MFAWALKTIIYQYIYMLLLLLFRPDITLIVDWALKDSYLCIYRLTFPFLSDRNPLPHPPPPKKRRRPAMFSVVVVVVVMLKSCRELTLI